MTTSGAYTKWHFDWIDIETILVNTLKQYLMQSKTAIMKKVRIESHLRNLWILKKEIISENINKNSVYFSLVKNMSFTLSLHKSSPLFNNK